MRVVAGKPRYAAVNFDRYGVCRHLFISFDVLVTVVMAVLKLCRYIVIPLISATKTLILLRGHSMSYILAPNDRIVSYRCRETQAWKPLCPPPCITLYNNNISL